MSIADEGDSLKITLCLEIIKRCGYEPICGLTRISFGLYLFEIPPGKDVTLYFCGYNQKIGLASFHDFNHFRMFYEAIKGVEKSPELQIFLNEDIPHITDFGLLTWWFVTSKFVQYNLKDKRFVGSSNQVLYSAQEAINHVSEK